MTVHRHTQPTTHVLRFDLETSVQHHPTRNRNIFINLRLSNNHPQTCKVSHGNSQFSRSIHQLPWGSKTTHHSIEASLCIYDHPATIHSHALPVTSVLKFDPETSIQDHPPRGRASLYICDLQ